MHLPKALAIGSAATAALLILSGPAVGVGKTSRHHFTTTGRLSIVETAGGFPGLGGSAVAAAVIETSFDGGESVSGASVEQITITGQPDPTTLEFTERARDHYPRGSIKIRYTGTAALQPDASATLTIAGKITGGTGAFRGARGTSTTTAASSNPLTDVIVFETEGTISY